MSSTTNRLASPPSAIPRAVRVWRNAVFVIFAALGVFAATLAARIPTISVALGLNTAQVGVLLFGIAVGSIAGLLAASHIVATCGARHTIAVAYVLSAVGMTGAAFSIAVLHSFALSFASLIVNEWS